MIELKIVWVGCTWDYDFFVMYIYSNIIFLVGVNMFYLINFLFCLIIVNKKQTKISLFKGNTCKIVYNFLYYKIFIRMFFNIYR